MAGEPVAGELVDLLAVPEAAWRDLAARAADANVFFDPDWARAVARHADGASGAQALLVWDGPMRRKLIGLLPVVSAWRAYRIPVPALVAWQAYAPLTTPLIDRDCVEAGARGLVAAARKAGALALVLPFVATESAAAEALRRAVVAYGRPRGLNAHRRACLDATQDDEAAVETLGAKRRKEFRRQRSRLGEMAGGEAAFAWHDGIESARALDSFLALEAAGWKGARGSALGQSEGDRSFVREAVCALASRGGARIATLTCAGRTVAAGILLRHLQRGFFFKIAYDEAFAKTSPGVQLTLDLTRAACSEPTLHDIDSLAVADHPMIDHLWRSRLAIGDLLLPVRRDGAGFAAIFLAIAVHDTLRKAAKRGWHFLRARFAARKAG